MFYKGWQEVVWSKIRIWANNPPHICMFRWYVGGGWGAGTTFTHRSMCNSLNPSHQLCKSSGQRTWQVALPFTHDFLPTSVTSILFHENLSLINSPHLLISLLIFASLLPGWEELSFPQHVNIEYKTLHILNVFFERNYEWALKCLFLLLLKAAWALDPAAQRPRWQEGWAPPGWVRAAERFSQVHPTSSRCPPALAAGLAVPITCSSCLCHPRHLGGAIESASLLPRCPSWQLCGSFPDLFLGSGNRTAR